MSKVLFVVTGARYWTLADGSRHPTGYWAEELVQPYLSFSRAGFEIVVATPGGSIPVVDKASLAPAANGGDSSAAVLAEQLEAIKELQGPIALDKVNPSEFATVFYPGGHGPMEDLSSDSCSAQLLAATLSSGKPLGLVCHAPAALLATEDAVGSSPFAGYRLTGTRATGGTDYTDADLGGRLALVLGNEGSGLPQALDSLLDGTVTIAMAEASESLNVAMAAAVLCFEARRRHPRPLSNEPPGRGGTAGEDPSVE